MEYYILRNNVKEGPYTLEDLKNKGIGPRTMVWAVGFTNWMEAKDVNELVPLLQELPPDPVPAVMPKTWLVESILVTILCCLPFGVVGIVNASKVEGLYNGKNYERAAYYSAQAKKWVLWGFFSGIVFIGLYLIFLLFCLIMGFDTAY